MKIAIFGGGFDPPHKAHELIVDKLLASFDIDKLIIVPAFISMSKNEHEASALKRPAWVEALWGGREKINIIDYELKQKKRVPSVQTCKYIRSIYTVKKLFLVIGADHLKGLKNWEGIEELKRLCEFIVVKRAGIKIPKNYLSLDVDLDISSEKIRLNRDFSLVNEGIKKDIMKGYKCKD